MPKMLTELSLNELKILRSMQLSRRAIARQLFPDQPEKYIRSAKDVYNYAWNRSVALDCKEQGKTTEFLIYQGIANRIWSNLPKYAWYVPDEFLKIYITREQIEIFVKT